MSRTYGILRFVGDKWEMECDPHVRIRAKSLFKRLSAEGSLLRLKDGPDVCLDLKWFMSRYPMRITQEDLNRLNRIVAGYQEEIARVDDLIDGKYQPREITMAIPPRIYQKIAAEIVWAKRRLLLADDLGLGKTVSAITTMTDPKTLPCVVICPPILRMQWQQEIERFMPGLVVHIISSSNPYELPRKNGRGPDVVIVSYFMIKNWVSILCKYLTTVVFDEAGELCRDESEKYKAAKEIAQAAEYRMGLSGTPIKNYGGEIFNLMECIAPGVLGAKDEFMREWCPGSSSSKAIVQNPNALGAWLKSEHLMLRRVKKDVGRELPELLRVTHPIDSNLDELKKIQGKAGELAQIILRQSGVRSHIEEMNALSQMSSLLREATGLAKAPYVADFVEMLIESGERVVLFGWHRAVYSIWLQKLKQYKPAFYTGSETESRKAAEKKRFVQKETPLLIMSLRSGIGVDGLQNVANTTVFGELDWTPSVHEQCIGRLHRDGQSKQVSAYFLVSNTLLDPMMVEVLGLKKDQVEGIRDDAKVLQRSIDSAAIVRRIAAQFLQKKSVT